MTLSEALNTHKPIRRGGFCTVCSLLLTLPESDIKALNVALADTQKFGGAALERLLKAEGHVIGSGAVNRHRRGECQ